MRALQSNLYKGYIENLCFWYENFNLPLTSHDTFVTMDSPDRLLSTDIPQVSYLAVLFDFNITIFNVKICLTF